jgi:hypothetical protein
MVFAQFVKQGLTQVEEIFRRRFRMPSRSVKLQTLSMDSALEFRHPELVEGSVQSGRAPRPACGVHPHATIVKPPRFRQARTPRSMKLFVIVFGLLLMVAFLTWMTVSLQKIQVHRDEMKRVQAIAQQQTNTP